MESHFISRPRGRPVGDLPQQNSTGPPTAGSSLCYDPDGGMSASLPQAGETDGAEMFVFYPIAKLNNLTIFFNAFTEFRARSIKSRFLCEMIYENISI